MDTTEKNINTAPPDSGDGIYDLVLIEDQFRNQLEFKILSVLSLLNLSKEHQKEIASFVDQLHKATNDNIDILTAYLPSSYFSESNDHRE